MAQTGVGKLISGLGGVGGLFSVGSSLLGGILGAGQKSRGKKMLSQLQDPGYKIPKEFGKNLLVAEEMARTGLPSQEYNLASTNIQRGTQAGLRQLGRMSNPFAGIAGLQRGQSDAFARLDASNAAARRQNILGAMGARRELAGQKLAQQQYNQRRYDEAVNEANALLGAGSQNVAGSLGSLGQFGLMQSLYGQKPGAKPQVTGADLPSSSVLNNPGVGQYTPTTINWGQTSSAPSYLNGPFPVTGIGNPGLFGLPPKKP